MEILEGIVPNVNGKMICINNQRTGRKCAIIDSKSGKLKSAREASFVTNGIRLFNVLPKEIRNITAVSTESFKGKLDKFLASVPDEPILPEYSKYRRANSNSLIDMIDIYD